FHSLLQDASDSILVLDADATIRYASASSQRVLGYEPASLVGTSVSSHLHAGDAAHLRDFIADALCHPGTPISIEFRFQHADGRWRTLAATGNSRLFEATVAGIVMTVRDETERKRAEE